MTGETLHGVNLSGWLMPESWVTPQLFEETGADDDLSLLERLGAEEYNRRVGQFRDHFVSEADFRAMAARGFDAVRIPVPWYCFGEAGPLPEGRESCIEHLDRAFGWAEANGIAVLIDLALVPGATFSVDGLSLVVDPQRDYVDASLAVVSALASRYADRPGLLGIEPLDQVVVATRSGFKRLPGLPLAFLRNYYRAAYDAIRDAAGEAVAVVFPDAGMHRSWSTFMAHSRYQNVWLDCHLYQHAESCAGSGPSGVRQLLRHTKAELAEAQNSGFPVMVGEWSSALPVASDDMTPEGRLALSRVYTSGQLAAFEGCPAWFFQTWKTATGDTAWDARLALSSFDRDMLD